MAYVAEVSLPPPAWSEQSLKLECEHVHEGHVHADASPPVMENGFSTSADTVEPHTPMQPTHWVASSSGRRTVPGSEWHATARQAGGPNLPSTIPNACAACIQESILYIVPNIVVSSTCSPRGSAALQLASQQHLLTRRTRACPPMPPVHACVTVLLMNCCEKQLHDSAVRVGYLFQISLSVSRIQ